MVAVNTIQKMVSPAAVRVGARLHDLVSQRTALAQRPVIIGGGDSGMPQKMYSVSWRVKSFQGYSSPEPVLFGIDLEPAAYGHETGIKRTQQVRDALESPLAGIRDQAVENLRALMDFPSSNLTQEPVLFPLLWSGNYPDAGSIALELFGRTYDCVIGLSPGPEISFDKKDYLPVSHIGSILGGSLYDLLMAKYTPRKNDTGPHLKDFSIFPEGAERVRIGIALEKTHAAPVSDEAIRGVQQRIIHALHKEYEHSFRKFDCQAAPDPEGFDALFDCYLEPENKG